MKYAKFFQSFFRMTFFISIGILCGLLIVVAKSDDAIHLIPEKSSGTPAFYY